MSSGLDCCALRHNIKQSKDKSKTHSNRFDKSDVVDSFDGPQLKESAIFDIQLTDFIVYDLGEGWVEGIRLVDF